jgi:hypothetical protein
MLSSGQFSGVWILYADVSEHSRRVGMKYGLEILHTYLPKKMEQIECSETSVYTFQTPGNYPQESIQHSVFVFCEVDWPVQWAAEISYLQSTLSESVRKPQRIPTILSPAVKHNDFRMFEISKNTIFMSCVCFCQQTYNISLRSIHTTFVAAETRRVLCAVRTECLCKRTLQTLRAEFDPRSLMGKIGGEQVESEEVFVLVLRFSPVTVIPLYSTQILIWILQLSERQDAKPGKLQAEECCFGRMVVLDTNIL